METINTAVRRRPAKAPADTDLNTKATSNGLFTEAEKTERRALGLPPCESARPGMLKKLPRNRRPVSKKAISAPDVLNEAPNTAAPSRGACGWTCPAASPTCSSAARPAWARTARRSTGRLPRPALAHLSQHHRAARKRRRHLARHRPHHLLHPRHRARLRGVQQRPQRVLPRAGPGSVPGQHRHPGAHLPQRPAGGDRGHGDPRSREAGQMRQTQSAERHRSPRRPGSQRLALGTDVRRGLGLAWLAWLLCGLLPAHGHDRARCADGPDPGAARKPRPLRRLGPQRPGPRRLVRGRATGGGIARTDRCACCPKDSTRPAIRTSRSTAQRVLVRGQEGRAIALAHLGDGPGRPGPARRSARRTWTPAARFTSRPSSPWIRRSRGSPPSSSAASTTVNEAGRAVGFESLQHQARRHGTAPAHLQPEPQLRSVPDVGRPRDLLGGTLSERARRAPAGGSASTPSTSKGPTWNSTAASWAGGFSRCPAPPSAAWSSSWNRTQAAWDGAGQLACVEERRPHVTYQRLTQDPAHVFLYPSPLAGQSRAGVAAAGRRQGHLRRVLLRRRPRPVRTGVRQPGLPRRPGHAGAAATAARRPLHRGRTPSSTPAPSTA